MFSLTKPNSSITDMIRADHTMVMGTFHQYAESSSATARKALAATLCDALEVHATLEEEILYPVLRRLDPADPIIQKSEPEHDEMRRLVTELRATGARDQRHAQLMNELMRDVMHHVADEETILLAAAERMLGEQRLQEMGAQMTRRRLSLVKEVAAPSGRTAAVVVGLAGAALAAGWMSRTGASAADRGTAH